MEDICVYTDGSCSNNGYSNANAGIGIYFGENDPRNLSRKIEGKQTNNTAELKAIIVTYGILEKEINEGKNILICSDSQYAIRCCTTYGEKCAKSGWKKKIPNLKLVKEAYSLFSKKNNIKFKKVLAHTNGIDKDSVGNDWADKLANSSIAGIPCLRRYLNVPYHRKEQIKALGGRWDPDKKSWYVSEKIFNEKCKQIQQIIQ
tara:strand:+ start:126 stop:734 length:609 start_codon:yes stop_codon:yes gene_type:complete